MKKLLLIFLFLSFISILKSQDYCSMVRKTELIPGAVSPTFSPLECLVDVKFYYLDLEVNATTEDISGAVLISFEMLGNSDSIGFELGENVVVDSVYLDNLLTGNYLHSRNIIKVWHENELTDGSIHSVKIFYKAGPSFGGGLYQGVTQRTDNLYGKDVTWTLSEPFQAKDWFPCKQDLHDKADSVWVFLTTPLNQMAGSNGILTNITSIGTNKHRFEWKSGYPISYYLISFSVSDYIDYSFYSYPEGYDSILVQNFIYDHPDIFDREKLRIDETAPLLSFFSEIFGEYPFKDEKYGHCMAPIGGGMEHQTMTTLQNFNFELVAHELAHQWFGDNVTCGSWRDIWVNEGFASYSEYLSLERLKGIENARSWMDGAHSQALNYPNGSIYLSEEEAGNTGRIFNYALSYRKGASILHMLRYEIDNDELFFDIMKDYQIQFKDSVAVASDFIEVVNSITGDDYNWFFDQWYYGKGYPVFQSRWLQNNDSISIECLQFPSSEDQTVFLTHMEYKFRFEDGTDTIVKVNITSSLNNFTFPLSKRVDSVIADPNGMILMNHTVYRYFPDSAFYEVLPNPFFDTFRLIFKDFRPGTLVYITDLNGKMILKEHVDGKTADFNLSRFQEGIYLFVAVDDNGRRYATRIIKLNQK